MGNSNNIFIFDIMYVYYINNLFFIILLWNIYND